MDKPAPVCRAGVAVLTERDARNALNGPLAFQRLQQLIEAQIPLAAHKKVKRRRRFVLAQFIIHQRNVIAAQYGLDILVNLLNNSGNPPRGGELEAHGRQPHHVRAVLGNQFFHRFSNPVAPQDKVCDVHVVADNIACNRRDRKIRRLPPFGVKVGGTIRH